MPTAPFAKHLPIVAALALLAAPSFADEYRVTIDRADVRLAHVEAEITPTSDSLLLLSRDAGDSGIEGGWARFLVDLEVRDASGVPVAVEETAEGTYGVGTAQGPLGVRYSMRLEHDPVDNLPGADELAWARQDAVFWSGRALFLEGAPTSDIGVSFELPESWRATTSVFMYAGQACRLSATTR